MPWSRASENLQSRIELVPVRGGDAGGVLFTRDLDGNNLAFDAASGRVLLETTVGDTV
jgi:hypothetical protein